MLPFAKIIFKDRLGKRSKKGQRKISSQQRHLVNRGSDDIKTKVAIGFENGGFSVVLASLHGAIEVSLL